MEAIRERRTTYYYKPLPVSEEVLMGLLEAATWAPSLRNAQPWEFILVGPQGRAALRDLYQAFVRERILPSPIFPEFKKKIISDFMVDFGGAPVVMAVVSRPPEMAVDHEEYLMGTAAAVQNIMLAAHDCGLGSAWLSIGRLPAAREILALPEGYTVIATLVLGYPERVGPPPPREPAAGKLRRIP
ncbi:MAG: nitroreductase family protein [Thermoanaerobacterales bacterium]|nr:nitroreductase family protein [Bacillota bacterium]MDI6905865.1 nitroreductase family protein [Thermoanaerobacterales bacterium]